MGNLNINNQNDSINLSTLRIPRMIPLKEVIYFTGLSSTTIYDILDKNSNRYDPTFPVQVKLSKGRVAWVESEIGEWINTKIEERSV